MHWGNRSNSLVKPFGHQVNEIWYRLHVIKEVAFLAERDAGGAVEQEHRIPFVTHNKYWNLNASAGAANSEEAAVSHCARKLRATLNLLEE